MEEINEDQEIIMIIVSNSDKEPIKQNIEVHSCNVCAMDFESSDDYIQHTRTLSHINIEKRSRNVHCHICEKQVKKSNLRAHILQTHKSEPTTLVKQFSIDNITLDSHSNKSLLHTVAQKDSINSKMECVVRHKLTSKAYYNSNFKEHGSEAEKVVRQRECNIFHKSFNYTYYTDYMKKVYSRKSRKKLPESTSETETDRKSNQVTSKPDITTRYVCERCGKVFKRPYGFKLHVMTHGSELKYKCMFCPYRGLHQGLLKIHVRTHTGDYNYKCMKCPARFTTKSNLNKHLNRHAGPVNFKCDICHKGFYSKPDLDRHYNVHHLGIKNHVCNICGKAFGYRNTMMCHQLKVHKRQKLTQGKGRLPSYLQAEINKSEE